VGYMRPPAISFLGGGGGSTLSLLPAIHITEVINKTANEANTSQSINVSNLPGFWSVIVSVLLAYNINYVK
jgi:hypothetical protein